MRRSYGSLPECLQLSYDDSAMFSQRTNWPLTPNRFTVSLEEARRSGTQIIDLTVSNPTRAGLAYDEAAILDPLCNRKVLDYDPQPKGLRVARETIAGYYAERGHNISPEFLFLTTGTSEAYSFVFRLLANPGDEILVAKPSYPLFDFLADLQDVNLVPYCLLYDHGWQIDFHTLKRAINERTRAIVLVHPNNPTGSFVKENEREHLNEICARHNLALVVDEVFLDYSHDGVPRHSFVSNDSALTFTLSGLSKISALPQMKLAWIVVSGPIEQVRLALERLEVIADTYLSVSAPVQWAAQTLLEQRRTIQPQLATRISGNLAELDRQLAEQKFCSCLIVEGGWYAVLRVPATRSDEDLATDLLRERQVLVHPGHFYDFPSDGYIVLSLIATPEEFFAGISGLMEFFEHL